MKIIQILVFFGILTTGLQTSQAQSKPSKIQETQLKVQGVCGMCEARIEEAARIKGVKMADWDKKTKLLTIVFNPKKTSLKTVQQAVADAGHDTETIAAGKEHYQKLPGCCKYRDGRKTH